MRVFTPARAGHFGTRGSRGTSLAVAIVAAATVSAGCTRHYLYRAERPPIIEGTKLVLEDEDGRVRTPTVRTVLAQAPRSLGGWRHITRDELTLLRGQASLPGVDTLRVTVDNTEVIWGRWAVGGFGVGFATGIGLIAALGGFSPVDGFESGGLTLPLTVLIAATLGLEFALIGAAVGELVDGGDVDLRWDWAEE